MGRDTRLDHFMTRLLSAAAVFLALCGTSFAAKECKETAHGKCFKIHARYREYTGDGQFAIWPVGSRRYLRPLYGDEMIRERFEDKLDNNDVFGDFELCPLEKEIAGKERNVCIKEARNLHLSKKNY